MSAASEHRLTISRRAWRRLVRELVARGRGERESGAFLLARTDRSPRRIAAVVFFDDIDPDALNGAIAIRGASFSRLWEICSARDMRVVGDVHTHPSGWVDQSAIDAANPMVATRGHVAVILPRFAQRATRPRDAGVHIYEGDHKWASAFGDEAAALIRRTWW